MQVIHESSLRDYCVFCIVKLSFFNMSLQGYTKIRFGHLLPVLGEEMDNGELVIEGGIIREISRRPIETLGSTIDLSNYLVLPGFVNAHCHLALSALQGKVPRLEKFTDWAENLVKQNITISQEERIRSLRIGAEVMMHSGVTTLADYLALPELLAEYRSLPFRQLVFLEVLRLKSSAMPEIMTNVERVLNEFVPTDGIFSLGLAPHAPYSVSPELFRSLKRLAVSQGYRLSCHVAEFPEEVRFLKDGGGDLYELFCRLNTYDEGWKPPDVSPVRYLDSLGALDSLLAVHLNHVTEDVELLRAKGVSAVFCPASTQWFGRKQYMPVRRLLDLGIAVGLGTDSLASNDSLNFFKELRAAAAMLPDVGKKEILDMATHGGAAALGLRTGVIAPGMPADIIAIRVDRPASGLWIDALFDPQRGNVDFVMVNGKTVLIK